MLEHFIFLQRTLNTGKLINLESVLYISDEISKLTLGLCFQSMK